VGKLIEVLGSIDAWIVLAIVVFNSLLSAAVAILDFVKKPLAKDHWLFRVTTWLQKVLDFISANKKHK
jgi:hypothetical protein